MLPSIAPARNTKTLGQRYVAVFSSKTLNFNERVIYSYLAWRDRIGLGASARQIAESTGLARRHAIPDAIKGLRDRGLIEKRGRSWHAIEPSEGIFSARDSSILKHWSDGLQSFKLFVPKPHAKIGKRRFSIDLAAVFSLALSFSRTGYRTCRRQMGQILSLDRSTICRHLRSLEQANLMTVIDMGDRLSFEFPEFDDQQRALFRPVDPAPASKNEKSKAEIYTDPHDIQVFEFCQEAGFYASMITKIVAAARRIDFRLFKKCAHEAHATHRYKHANDQYGRLLLFKLNEILKTENKARRKQEEERAWQKELERRENEAREKALRPPTEAEIKLRAEIDADPLHPERSSDWIFGGLRNTWRDIMARANVSQRVAENSVDKIERHLRSERHLDWEEQRQPLCSILAHALALINQYYGQETKASLEEYQGAVNRSLEAHDLPPLYDLPKPVEAKPVEPRPDRSHMDPAWVSFLEEIEARDDESVGAEEGDDFIEDDEWTMPVDDQDEYVPTGGPVACVVAVTGESSDDPYPGLAPEFLKEIGF